MSRLRDDTTFDHDVNADADDNPELVVAVVVDIRVPAERVDVLDGLERQARRAKAPAGGSR